MTSNTSELNFQKTLPKHVKRRMEVMKGSKKKNLSKYEYRNRKLEEKYEEKLLNPLTEMVETISISK